MNAHTRNLALIRAWADDSTGYVACVLGSMWNEMRPFGTKPDDAIALRDPSPAGVLRWADREQRAFESGERICQESAEVLRELASKLEEYDMDIETMLSAYIEAALWSSTDDDGDPLDSGRDADDIAPETLDKMRSDCSAFAQAHEADINGKWKQAGHDFWFTRNGHGCGFWDGDWPEDVGERLTEASKRFGEVYLYVGDDGKVYS